VIQKALDNYKQLLDDKEREKLADIEHQKRSVNEYFQLQEKMKQDHKMRQQETKKFLENQVVEKQER